MLWISECILTSYMRDTLHWSPVVNVVRCKRDLRILILYQGCASSSWVIIQDTYNNGFQTLGDTYLWLLKNSDWTDFVLAQGLRTSQYSLISHRPFFVYIFFSSRAKESEFSHLWKIFIAFRCVRQTSEWQAYVIVLTWQIMKLEQVNYL